jgi:arginase
MTDYEILAAPSVLGLFPRGVERLPEALLEAGLATTLRARVGATVVPPRYSSVRDTSSGLLNPSSLAAYAATLADEVAGVLDRGAFPIVLGGDCSILLGPLLALRRRGRFGLLFVDGHADFAHPSEEPSGEAASMDLALATGRGPEIVTDVERLGRLVRDEDVAVLGYRASDGTDRNLGIHLRQTPILVRDLADIRKEGLAAVLGAATARLTRHGPEGFFIHLDADVLADAIMPAVDYREPDGLGFDEVAEILRVAVATGKAVGLEFTIFNPSLDADGSLAKHLVGMLEAGLS